VIRARTIGGGSRGAGLILETKARREKKRLGYQPTSAVVRCTSLAGRFSHAGTLVALQPRARGKAAGDLFFVIFKPE